MKQIKLGIDNRSYEIKDDIVEIAKSCEVEYGPESFEE